jgi:hypothetical protein
MSDVSGSQPAIPKSRIYRHEICRTECAVSDGLFETLSNPFLRKAQTWCPHCKAELPLTEFVWADTNEKIPDYYCRHSARATATERFLCSPACLAMLAGLGFLLGASLGYGLFGDKAWVVKAFLTVFVGGVGAFVFASFQDFIIKKALVWRICGVSDSRLLK